MTAQKRIGIVSATFPPTKGGGVSSAHEQLARQFEQAGHLVHRFSFLDPAPGGPGITRRNSPAWLRYVLRRTVRLLFRFFDSSGRAYQVSDILESLIGSWRLGGAIAAFNPDLLIIPDHGCPGLMLGLHRHQGRVVLIAHHNPLRFLDDPWIGETSILDAKMAVAIENRALRFVDGVVAPCTYMAQSFLSTYRFAGPLKVIFNSIDLLALDAISPYDPRVDMNLPPEALLIYIPSAGSRLKGSRFVPEIVRRLGEMTPHPVGFFLSGHLDRALQQDLQCRPSNVVLYMPGSLEFADNIARVKACSFTISPTLIENFSMALLESISAGLPVIAFDVGGNRELLGNSGESNLVERGDVLTLCQRAAQFLDSGFLAIEKDKVRSEARTRFTPDRLLSLWFGDE